MLSENWLEEILLQDETATTAAIPEMQLPTQEELVIREMVLLGEITAEEALTMLGQHQSN